MKNIVIFFSGLLLGAVIGFLSYNQISYEDQPEIQKPKGLISPKEAASLDQAFNLKHRIISDSLYKNATYGDNRSSWWSIDDVESFIRYAKHQADEQGYVLDGLRLYLGSHGESNDGLGLTTVFFIPTGHKNNAQGGWSYYQNKPSDLKDADGLNMGQSGNPPDANYPQ